MKKGELLYFDPNDERKEEWDIEYSVYDGGRPFFPAVLKLRLELMDPYGEADEHTREIIKTYGKSQDGTISREVLVSGDMDLHALHYLIQRTFGWQNSHMRDFQLPFGVFDGLINGRFERWAELCGVYFRFPDDPNDRDIFWDDEYDETIDFKKWLKFKYAQKFFSSRSAGDAYLDAQGDIADFLYFIDNDPKAKQLFDGISLNDLEIDKIMMIPGFGSGVTHLLERLPLGELLYARGKGGKYEDPEVCYEDSIELLEDFFEIYYDLLDDGEEMDEVMSSLVALRENRNEYFRILSDIKHSLANKKSNSRLTAKEKKFFELKFEIMDLELQCSEYINDWCPDIVSLTDELIYNYDYGDEWTVKITCEDAYGFNLDEETDGFIVIDKNCEPVKGDLRADVEKILFGKDPICLKAEGLNVLDDVGGLDGYADFLEALNEGPKDQARKLREWARSMGWTGRKVMPRNML